MVDIIDEAGVRIVAVIDPAFNAKVKKAVAKSLRGVDKQIKQSLRPVSRAVEDSIVQPFEKAGAKVSVISRTTGENIARGIESGTDEASREIGQMVTRANAELGRISADVDIDTSAAQSRIDAFLAANGTHTVDADLAVVTGMAQAEMDAFFASNLGDSLSIDLEVDTSRAQARIDAFLAANFGESLTFNLDLDTTRARARVDSFLANSLESFEVDLDVTTANAQAQVDAFLANSLDDLSVDLDVDTSLAEAQVDRFLADTLGQSIDIDLDVDTGFAQAEVDGFLAFNDGREINIDVDTQKGAFESITDSLDGIGSSAGRSTRLVRPLYAALGLLATAAVPLAGAVTVASGALLSAGAAASSLALGFTAVRVGSEGVGDAITAQSKAQEELARTGEISAATQETLAAAMENLAPAARDFVRTLVKIGPAWTKVRKATQQALFEGTAPLLQRLSDAHLPAVSRALEGVAGDFNEMARSATDALTSAGAVEGVSRALESMREQLQDIVPALGNIATGLGILFLGATGEAEDLAKSFLNVSETFEEFARRVTGDGSFQKFLDDATKAADSLFEAIGAVGGVIGTILTASSGVGVGALDTITNSFRALDEQLESVSGQRAIEGFFEGLYTVIGIVTDTIGNLGPVFSGLGDIFEAMEGPIQRLRDALEPFTRDLFKDVGDTLSSLADPIARATDSIAGFVEKIQPLAGHLGPVVVAIGALVGGVAALSTLAGPVTAVVSAISALAGLGPVIAAIASPAGLAIAAVVGAFVVGYTQIEAFRDSVNEAFFAVRDAVVDAWDDIRPALSDLWRTIQDDLIPAVTEFYEQIKPLVDFFYQQVVPAFYALAGEGIVAVIEAIEDTIKVLSAIYLGLATAIQWTKDFAQAVGDAFNATKDAVNQTIDFIGEKFGQFREALVDGVNATKRFVNRVVAFFTDLWTRSTDLVKRLSERVTEIFRNLPGAVGRALSSLPRVVTQILQSTLAAGRQKAAEIVSTIRQKIAELPGKIREIGGRLFDAGKAIMDRLVAGISSVGGVAGDIASGVGDALRGVMRDLVNTLNNAIPNSLGSGPFSIDLPDNPVPNPFANGGIVRRPTNALIGEAGPEVVLPLVSRRINRTLQLLRQSGLLDSPLVQREVLARTPVAATERITFPTQSASRITGTTSTKVTNNTINQTFTLAPVDDAETLFAQIANRMAAYTER